MSILGSYGIQISEQKCISLAKSLGMDTYCTQTTSRPFPYCMCGMTMTITYLLYALDAVIMLSGGCQNPILIIRILFVESI